MRGGGRLTNLALLCLLALAFASGWVAFELSGQPARATLVIHAAAGVAIVLLVPWKALVARRGLRRPHRLRWASLALALGLVVSLVFGFVHSFGRPNIGYLTAIDFHVGAAICVLPFVIWHVLARPAKLRRADLSRRNFLKGAALVDRVVQVGERSPDAVDVRQHACCRHQPVAACGGRSPVEL
jgi:heme A synthase